jgi:putative cell wall-binding protein
VLTRPLLALLILVGGLLVVAPPASADPPPRPAFGPEIDPYAAYDGQDTCDSAAKPGMVGLRDLTLQAYPATGSSGISRECGRGGRSEHKEGRAWDWRVNVTVPAEDAAADEMLGWLLASDEHGNPHAFARRLGVMYMIWDRRIWGAYQPQDGWRPYTGDNAHTDHVHFSLSRAGGLAQTTWWTGAPAAPPASPPVSDRVERTSGASRIETAIAVSLRAFPRYDSAERAIVASADRFTDAAAAATLAARYDAPLFLTGDGQSIEGDVQREIRRILGPESRDKQVVLVGGTDALPASKARASMLAERYRIRRVGGANRFETAARAATEGRTRVPAAILVSGDAYPDLLPMVAVAARQGWPILLTKRDQLSVTARRALERLQPETVHIAGPSAVVSDAVAAQVESLEGVDTVERHFAQTRHHTSAAMANRFFPDPGGVAVATGANWPDAILAGYHAGADMNAPVLLAQQGDLTAPVTDYVRGRSTSSTEGLILGGAAALDARPEQQLRALLP